MTPPDEAARRASRLLRWYPKAWRSRYGEEFAELLIADISERPRSRTRTADVVRGGIVARLAAFGLCGCTLEASAQVRQPDLARLLRGGLRELRRGHVV